MSTSNDLGPADTLAEAMIHLARTIDLRAQAADTTHSYTAKLLEAGPLKCAKKFLEEAGELGLSVAAETDTEIAAEAADTIYHMMVALRSRGVSLDAVSAALIQRQGISGIEEKAARAAN